ncbi:MAG: hypothetical protein ACJAT1_000369 [Marivirga sp.]|jgi:hypothetical protein
MSFKYAFFLFIISSPFFVQSQELHKYFEADHVKHTEKIKLNVTTKAGTSYINAISSKKPVIIYGGNENDVAASSFQIKTENKDHLINAKLTCKEHAGSNFTEAVAANIFNSSEAKNDMWQINLSDDVPFDLDLEYLVGSSTVDLSNLAVEKLKIKSGSADVFIRYSNKKQNTVAMDTFFIKVNMGSIEVQNLDLALAKEIIAEVGFGSITLDCGNNWKINSVVNASVGAGSMTIKLPPTEQAVLVKLNDSPLCKINLDKDFQKVGHNAYGNTAYRSDATNSISFSVEVGMGSISFITQ